MNQETLQKAFAQALKQIRQKAKVSQEQLAFDSNRHRTYISLLERGKYNPTLFIIFQICECLEVKPSEMVGEEAL